MTDVLIDDLHGNRIEGIYHDGNSSDSSTPLVLILHPHPDYGGTMHSKVIVSIEKALLKHKFTTLRFNFHQASSSTSSVYNNDVSELISASYCLDWLQDKKPLANKIFVAGFSFGAYIALQLMIRRTEVNHFISVGTPANMFDISFVHPSPIDGIFIHAEKDELCPLKDVEKSIKKIMKNKNRSLVYKIIPESDHFFTNNLELLSSTIDSYLIAMLEKESDN